MCALSATCRAAAPPSRALHRRARCARGRCVRVCSSSGGNDGVWALLESVKKARTARRKQGACGSGSSRTGAQKIEFELNYENWAPRGARAYRLREIPRDVLLRDADKVDDGELSGSDVPEAALVGERLAELARNRQPGEALNGQELAALCYAKYGVMHDMAIKQVSFPGLQRVVALNLYSGQLGQRSFPFTEEEYLAKLDAVAYLVNSFMCAEFVRAFFKQPVAPRAGLPSRPRVDTAVTLRLNGSPTWDNDLVEKIFESTGLDL